MITHPQILDAAAPDPDEERRRVQTARLYAYRDDGPLARALAPRLGFTLPPVPMLLVALLSVVALAVGGLLTSGFWLLLPALLMTLLVLPTTTHDHLGRFDWLTPPLVRGLEFLIIALVGLAADAPKWLLFVLLYVIGYHTYDTVYRTRQGIWPPSWLFQAGLGWELRLLIIGAGAATGQLFWVLPVLTVYLLVLFAVESVTSWVRLDQASAQAGAAAEQDLEASPEEVQEAVTGEADKG